MWRNTEYNFLFPQEQPLATDKIIMFIYKLSEQSKLTLCSTVNEDPATDIRVQPFQTPFQIHLELCHFSDFLLLLCRDNMPISPNRAASFVSCFPLYLPFTSIFSLCKASRLTLFKAKQQCRLKQRYMSRWSVGVFKDLENIFKYQLQVSCKIQ